MRTTTIACALLVCCGASHAADNAYPERPVRVIVPFPPGGGTDIVARLLMQKLGETLHATFVIDNRGGAGGTIGTDIVAKAPADGYTLGLVSASHAINPTLYRKLPYDTLKDFSAVTLLVSGPAVLVATPTLKVRTVQELVALAKAKPGSLTYASAGNGTPPHLAGELFKTLAGVDITHVPYKGNGPVMTDLIAGQVSMSFPTIPSALPMVRAGRIVALAVTSAQRSLALPELPTIAESGVPGYAATSWYGLVAPAGTPEPVRVQLQRALRQVMEAPELKAKLVDQGLEPVGDTPAEFAALIASEIAKWGKVVAASGARIE